MAIWNRLTAFVTGGAVATAAADAMAPEFEVLKQTAWANEPHKVLSPGDAAHLRARETVDTAQGIDLEGVDLVNDAARSGVGTHRFDLLTELARTEPAVAELLTLRRRGIATNDTDGIPAAEFRRLMRRQGYEAAWITEIEQLLHERLGVAQVALAVVRSLMDSGGLLVGENDTTGGQIAPTPVSPIDPRVEAAEQGIDTERLRVLINSIGLPMALDAAAQSVFRKIIDKPDFYLAVAQGDTRPAWADAIFEHARQILTANDYVQLYLRDWIDKPTMHAGVARHGMSAADADLLYLRNGRPPTARQMIVGYRRGARVDGIADSEDAYVAKSVRQSDIRPEYVELEHAANLSYPSAFVVRQITQAGGFTEQEASDVLYQSGWPRSFADKAANAFANPKATAKQTHVDKAEAQLWSTLHRSYVASETDDADAISTLQTLGLTPAEISAVIALWTLERDLTRKQLTPAQIKKAVNGKVINRVTGQPWTRDDALSALIARGYSATDSATFLDLSP